MSEAYECDRCGGLNSGSPDTALRVEDGYTRTAHAERTESREGQIRPKHIDLCKACLNDLRKWYNQAGGDVEDLQYE